MKRDRNDNKLKRQLIETTVDRKNYTLLKKFVFFIIQQKGKCDYSVIAISLYVA